MESGWNVWVWIVGVVKRTRGDVAMDEGYIWKIYENKSAHENNVGTLE